MGTTPVWICPMFVRVTPPSTTTINAGPVLPLITRVSGRLVRRAFTPRLDVAAARRMDVRHPPGRMLGCRIRPIRIEEPGRASVLVAELSPTGPYALPGRTLVHVHGGVHVSGPYWPQWFLVAALCRGVGVRTLVPLYRRAPEHPFPAAYDDITTVLDVIAEQAAGPVLLSGDSSGGGLAAAVAVHRDDIARLGLVSPWLDLGLAADDVDDRRDVLLAIPGLREAALVYADGYELSDPRLSPQYADLSNLPPTMLQASTEEVFWPDVQCFAERAAVAGSDIHLVEGRGLPHGWGTLPLAPEAAAARRLLINHLSA